MNYAYQEKILMKCTVFGEYGGWLNMNSSPNTFNEINRVELKFNAQEKTAMELSVSGEYSK